MYIKENPNVEYEKVYLSPAVALTSLVIIYSTVKMLPRHPLSIDNGRAKCFSF